jgi:hypothetical protein
MRAATAQVLRYPHLQEKRGAAFCRNQDAHAPILRACHQRTEWSGRWESNPNGRSFEACRIRRFVIQRKLRAIGVRIFAL